MCVLSLGSLLMHVAVQLPSTVCWNINSSYVKLPFYLCQRSVQHICESYFWILGSDSLIYMSYMTLYKHLCLVPELRRKYTVFTIKLNFSNESFFFFVDFLDHLAILTSLFFCRFFLSRWRNWVNSPASLFFLRFLKKSRMSVKFCQIGGFFCIL